MLRAAVAAAAGGYVALQWLGRRYGATSAECAGPMPGDGRVHHPNVQTTHATTIEVPPSEVWPWLIQMGWHQGGWYTARWVDQLLFPANDPSSDTILEALQDRTVGDVVPDGPPSSGCTFTIEVADVDRALVLHSTTHLPASWRERWHASLDWIWSFRLEDLPGGRTRLVFRTRARAAPWWVTAAYVLVLVPADFVMARQMLRGIRRRAERRADP